MSNSISSVTQAEPVQNAAPTPAAPAKTSPPAPQPVPADTVKISTAANAILQEVQETHTQTVHEANGGDSQAIRLIARQAAAKATPKA
jgi:hypothetical protein